MARDLSPFSQRRLLTPQLARAEVPNPPRVVAERAPSKEPERTSKEPSVSLRCRPRSTSREEKPRNRSRDQKLRDASPAASSSRRGRRGSPEPYRKPQDSSRNGKEDRRSEEHTSELQSHVNLVCRLLLEKKKKKKNQKTPTHHMQ